MAGERSERFAEIYERLTAIRLRLQEAEGWNEADQVNAIEAAANAAKDAAERLQTEFNRARGEWGWGPLAGQMEETP